MKKNLLLAALVLLSLSACRRPTAGSDDRSTADQPDTTLTEGVADSTLYGTACEFGMSTFSMVTDQGDTLYLTRTANDGTDDDIYGELIEGQRYALTTCDSGQAIRKLINLTQLERHVKDYRIGNGHLIMHGDTMRIATLNDHTCTFE